MLLNFALFYRTFFRSDLGSGRGPDPLELGEPLHGLLGKESRKRNIFLVAPQARTKALPPRA